MTFADSEEGRALRASVAGYLGRHFPISHARACYDQDGVLDRGTWSQLVGDLGIPAFVLPEAHGGLGAGFAALTVALEEAGRVVLPEPMLPTVWCSIVINEIAEEAVRAEFLPRIASGELIGTIAGFSEAEVQARDSNGSKEPNGTVALNGVASHVVCGATADLVVVLAQDDQRAPILALVDGDAPGMERRQLTALDCTRPLAGLALSEVQPRATIEAVEPERLDRARDLMALVLAAEQLGGARAALDMAVAYANTRVAFGRPIGSFQAIKHKLARVFIAIEAAAAVIPLAAEAADAGSAELSVLAATAKARASEAFVQAASENIQVHGGIGFTWEHDAHLHLKRARSSFELLGNPTVHYHRLAELTETADR